MNWIWQNVGRKGKTEQKMFEDLFICQRVSTSIFLMQKRHRHTANEGMDSYR